VLQHFKRRSFGAARCSQLLWVGVLHGVLRYSYLFPKQKKLCKGYQILRNRMGLSLQIWPWLQVQPSQRSNVINAKTVVSLYWTHVNNTTQSNDSDLSFPWSAVYGKRPGALTTVRRNINKLYKIVGFRWRLKKLVLLLSCRCHRKRCFADKQWLQHIENSKNHKMRPAITSIDTRDVQ